MGGATTPYVFPAVALATAVLLHRRERPEWEVELAGATGYIAFGLASAASTVALNAGPGAGAAISLVAAAIVAGLHRLVGIVRLTGWGLTASLVAFTGLASDAAGLLTSSSVPWWLIAQALAAVSVGALLLRRGSHAGAEAAWRSSSMLAITAAVAGVTSAGVDRLGPWQASPWPRRSSPPPGSTCRACSGPAPWARWPGSWPCRWWSGRAPADGGGT